MRNRCWVLALLAVVSVIVFSCCSTGNNGTTTGIGFLWVATKGDQRVTSFTVDLSSGWVSSVRSSVASGPNPSAMALTPDGKTLFVANVDANCASAGQAPIYCDRVRPFPINQTDGTMGTQGTAVQGTAVQITSTRSSTPLGMALGLDID